MSRYSDGENEEHHLNVEQNASILHTPSMYSSVGGDDDVSAERDLLENDDDDDVDQDKDHLYKRSNVGYDDDDDINLDHYNNDKAKLSQNIFKDESLPQLTVRASVVGIAVGALMCFSNMYFGLQAGWVTMGSLQSTLLGFLVFRLLQKKLSRHFNHFENVLLQTIAVATATMPLAGGFVAVIPAMKKMWREDHPNQDYPSYFSWWSLLLWSLGLAFFGVFFAVPLRKQNIIVEKLKFPSGTATAQMIRVLHQLDDDQVHTELLKVNSESTSETITSSKDFDRKFKILFISFGVSAAYKLLGYFFPVVEEIPLFGTYLQSTWHWALTPSPSYIGQGMIMGTKTGISLMIGAILGWAILGPIARNNGWATGSVTSIDGASGWTLWVALFIMISESLISLAIVLVRQLLIRFGYLRNHRSPEENVDPAPESQQVPRKWWISGLVVSTVLCVAIVSPLFDVPVYQTFIAVVLAMLTSVLAVRALGETDLNPVSGIGKISQIVFAFIARHNILANLVAGAVAEAGAQQAGDMMQDLKTGHLLKASPRIQFYGQLIGSFFSIFFAVAAYELYDKVGNMSENAPMANAWLGMARLVNGNNLAPHVLPFCIAAGVIVSFIPIIESINPHIGEYLPSGIAIAIGILVRPNYIIARCIGTVINWVWKRYRSDTYNEYMIVVASGLVLGEGVTSIFTSLLSIFHKF
ncbi:hypothetical protein PPL_08851 [Heterostelium album PN500]|uniref:Oligopeptide transporter n=1 Tax=Heterostelium pallidum (strain ATCC 26659 / Pp 5 / PN500) TaxID=670386 RepID=D3BJX1_HETP5|nr:hypothetical protein PPL_08851 [Heterostelium album PN500]EFA78201.1 hypothetical protein PPL_08851 [Heterostelium album PN500]|eukprot:XP_020430327.1 hypothetical protein PPL_08851 [Heterostelium album PN500]